MWVKTHKPYNSVVDNMRVCVHELNLKSVLEVCVVSAHVHIREVRVSHVAKHNGNHRNSI